MNVAEMHRRVNMLLDKINSMQADTLLAEEIDAALNMAQEQFIKNRYNRANKYARGFEESQKRIDDLSNLILDARVTCIGSEFLGNGYWRDIYVPIEQDADGVLSQASITDYMFLVSLKTQVNYVDCKYSLEEDIDYSIYDPMLNDDTELNNLLELAWFGDLGLTASLPRVPIQEQEDDDGNVIVPKQLKHKISLCKYVQNDDVYTLLEDPFKYLIKYWKKFDAKK